MALAANTIVAIRARFTCSPPVLDASTPLKHVLAFWYADGPSAPARARGSGQQTDVTRPSLGSGSDDYRVRYQAWVPPQCGQPTVVETGASNTYPHWHVYSAWSFSGPSSRPRRN